MRTMKNLTILMTTLMTTRPRRPLTRPRHLPPPPRSLPDPAPAHPPRPSNLQLLSLRQRLPRKTRPRRASRASLRTTSLNQIATQATMLLVLNRA